MHLRRKAAIRRSGCNHLWGGMTEKPQNITINMGSKTTGPVSATLADLSTSRAKRYSWPWGKLLFPREDGCTFIIAFHYQYFFLPWRINRGYASVAKRLWRERQPDRRWPHQSGHQIPRLFPYSGTISTTPSYNDTGQILTGGPPAARRGDKCAVLLQDNLPSTASSPLQRTSWTRLPRGGILGQYDRSAK